MSAPSIPPEVFYSYAESDEALLNELEKHLSMLKHESLITTWHTRQIIAGTNWKETLDSHLNTASVILLLISADFLASDYCYSIAMQQAMQRHEAGTAHIIPVLLRPVADWQSTPFGGLAPLPSNGQPITTWSNRDAAFANVVQGLRMTLEKTSSPRVNLSSPSPFLATQPSPEHSTIIVRYLRGLLSYAKLRGKGIHLSNITLFGSRIDIDT